MARVTVEDCIKKIPNRFQLVLAAAQRVRQVMSGSPITVDKDNDKLPVIALREIADGTIDLNSLHDALLKTHSSILPSEEEEILEMIAEEQHWIQEPESAQMHEEILEEGLEIESENSEQFSDEDFKEDEE